MSAHEYICTGILIGIGFISMLTAGIATCLWFGKLGDKIDDIHGWSKK